MFCYLIRHGQDDDTVRGGWSDSSLTDEGRRQANELAKFLKIHKDYKIKKLYTSDLVRSLETAAPIAEVLGIPAIQMSEFRDVNNGDLAGMDNKKALQLYPSLFWNTLEWKQKYPNGESPYDFYIRVFEAWKAFETQIIESQESIALVTHAGVITVILDIIQGKQYSNKEQHEKIPCTSIISLEFIDGHWKKVDFHLCK